MSSLPLSSRFPVFIANNLFLVFCCQMAFSQGSLDERLLQNVKQNNFDSVKLLVELGADMNFRDTNQAPIVMWAALKGDLAMVKYLVSKGADVRKKGIIKSKDGYYIYGNITGIAVVKRNLPMLKFLVEDCGIPINDKELDASSNAETGWDALAYALEAEDTLIPTYIVSKYPGLSPLELRSISVTFKMNLDGLIIERLKPYFDARRSDSLKLLLCEFIKSDFPRVVNAIIPRLPNLKFRDQSGNTFLTMAVMRNYPQIIQLLIEGGHSVDEAGENGKTPLFYAIENHNYKLADELIRKGADINHRDSLGRTPLIYSVLLANSEMVSLLINSGVDVNKPDLKNTYPLSMARERNYQEIADQLRKAKASDDITRRQLKPKLLVPPSSGGFSKLSVSANEKYLLGYSEGLSYIWEIKSRKLIRVSDRFYGAEFFSDNILVDNSNVKVFYWDIQREEFLKINYLPSNFALASLISGRDVLSSALQIGDRTLNSLCGRVGSNGEPQLIASDNGCLFDLTANKIIANFKGYIVASSPNGKYFLVHNQDSLIVFDLDSRSALKSIPANPFSDYFFDCLVSNNGKFLILRENSKDSAGMVKSTSSLIWVELETAKHCAYPDGRQPSFMPNDSCFGFIQNDVLNVYKYKGGDPELMLEKNGVSSFYFANDNKSVYYSTTFGLIKKLNLNNWKEDLIVSGFISQPAGYYSDSASNLLKIGFANNYVTFDLSRGLPVNLKSCDYKGQIRDLVFSKNGNFAIGTASVNKTRNWNLLKFDYSGDQTNYTILQKTKWPYSYSVSPDEKTIAISDNQGIVLRRNNGDVIHSGQLFQGPQTSQVCFSNNGNVIAVACDYHYRDIIRQIDVNMPVGILKILKSNTLDTVFSGTTPKPISSLAFSGDDRRLFALQDDGGIDVIDIVKKETIKRMQVDGFQTYFYIPGGGVVKNSISFIGGTVGNKFYISTRDSLYIIDVNTLEIVSSQKLVAENITISGNEKWLFFPSSGGATKVWDIKANKELCSIYIIDSIDWVVRTPNGLFDASQEAMKKMSLVVGMETIDLDQLKYRYYQPGLLPIILGYSNEKPRDVPAFDYVRLFPEINLAVSNTSLSIKLKNRGGGLGKVSVYLDKIRFIEDARMSLADSSKPEVTLSIDLSKYANFFRYDTANAIKVVAWNAEGYLSSRPTAIDYTPPPASAKGVQFIVKDKNGNRPMPRLYALIVGTSDYSGDQIDLKYAAKDAEAFSNALMVGATRLFGKDHVSITLLASGKKGAEPTMNNIRSQLDSLKKAGPDDIVVVYFSGHGVNYGGQDGMFYYLTMGAEGLDARYLNDPAFRTSKALSSQDISNSLNRIPAQKKVLVLDACSSGRAADNLLASLTRDVPSSQKRALEFTQDATGAYLLASSAANTVSYESPVYEHGLLTYTLLQGMRGGQLSTIESDEYIEVEALFQYARREVPKLASDINGIQDPVLRTPGVKGSLYIGRMTEDDKKQIVLSEPKSVFMPCSFLNANEDLTAEEIDVAERLNAKLDQLSVKGSGSDIRFARVGSYPDGYTLKGRYTVRDQEISISYILKKGSKVIGAQQTESGRVEALDQILEKIIANVKKMTGQ